VLPAVLWQTGQANPHDMTTIEHDTMLNKHYRVKRYTICTTSAWGEGLVFARFGMERIPRMGAVQKVVIVRTVPIPRGKQMNRRDRRAKITCRDHV
jgi:hypothetical protein